MTKTSDLAHINFKLEEKETIKINFCKEWLGIHNNNDVIRFALSFTYHALLKEKNELD